MMNLTYKQSHIPILIFFLGFSVQLEGYRTCKREVRHHQISQFDYKDLGIEFSTSLKFVCNLILDCSLGTTTMIC